ncbi:MAG: hypothetical protein PSV13_03820 [Lacunisphaera sp.]|nr:hypothetical protein [Lacunisphaera sp.]
MITTPIKDLAAARENPVQPERTVANELPQELSRLPGQYGFTAVNSCVKEGKAAARGGGRRKAGRPKKGAAIPKTRQRSLAPTAGFTDDGHPTILAATRG